MIKKSILILSLGLAINSFACTSFGYITDSGTVIAKNRDFYYSNQTLQILQPTKKYKGWYANNLNNQYKIFAVMADKKVRMGINQMGLAAIEEDPTFPKHAKQHKQYWQPAGGYNEAEVLQGVLQNFATVDEIKPYLDDIFSHAAPNYYEFSDAHKILIIEVAYGINAKAPVRDFSYKIINKSGQEYTHTNYYLYSPFDELNKLSDDGYTLVGTIARNHRIQNLLAAVDRSNEADVVNMLMDTKSDLKNPSDPNWCLNTSVFRSNLQSQSSINTHTKNNKIYGSMSSMVVFNNGTPQKTDVWFKIIDSITTDRKGNQHIAYRMVTAKLSDLFANDFTYENKVFIRQAPVNGNCK